MILNTKNYENYNNYRHNNQHNNKNDLKLSSSSRKLLEKLLILALNLEKRAISKFPSVNFNSSHKRLLLLFSALKLISMKFDVGSKFLQMDWLIEILSQGLCKVRFEVGLKVLKVEGGIKKLFEDLKVAKKLQAFQVLRAALRRDENLKLKVAKEEAQSFLLTFEKRKTLILQENNLKLEENPRETLKHFLHIWRCILNLRLVKERTRKRFKSLIINKLRKITRVSRIAGIYHGKKVKLRLMNRWFSKKFGRTKEHQLTMRLNDFIARKKRRAMFLTRDEVTKSYALTAKGLFQIWRHELKGRRADSLFSSRLLSKFFRKLSGNLSLNQGRAQTSRLYNEIRLLKNFFYKWFSSIIPDRFVFERDRMILTKRDRNLKVKTLKKWLKKSNEIILLENQWKKVEIYFKNGKINNFLSKWNLLTKQHGAQLIWTENFRITEDLRNCFYYWRSEAKNQIISDTKYQFNLCKNNLNIWKKLFEERQEKRFQLRRFFKNWKSSSQGRRGLRFLRGQELLRNLTRLKVSNSILASTLEFSSNFNNFESPNYSKKIVFFFKWKGQIKRIETLEDCGNLFLLERMKKILQIWKLKASELNVIKTEPFRIKLKTFQSLLNQLSKRREKCESLDGQLFHYYTNRAVQLESFYFHQWEKAFQVTQIGENCCIKVLKLWESQKRKDLFRRWQCQTAGIIFGKCKRITEQQGIFTLWRRSCKNEVQRRSLRILSKHFQIWGQVNRQRILENREIQFRHLRTKLKKFSIWKLKLKEMIQSWSRANDFFFIVRGCKSIDLWKQKLEALRIARSKTQTLLLLRAPVVRKPRFEQIMANALSLSDVRKHEHAVNDQITMENLNIAELSV